MLVDCTSLGVMLPGLTLYVFFMLVLLVSSNESEPFSGVRPFRDMTILSNEERHFIENGKQGLEKIQAYAQEQRAGRCASIPVHVFFIVK